MAHVGTLRDFHFGKDVDDIRGASIYGPDDSKLGKVDDIIFNHATGAVEYLVVDTGGWLSSRQFLVPANRVDNRPNDPRDLRCDFTKDQIERMPAYDEKMTETDANWGDYEHRYRESVSTAGGVLHREGSDHLITPEADEQPAATGSRANVTPLPPRVSSREMTGSGEFTGSAYGNPRAQGTPPLSNTDPEAYRQSVNGEMTPGRGAYPVRSCQRLRDFENHLMRNRVDVTASCRSCAVQRDKAA